MQPEPDTRVVSPRVERDDPPPVDAPSGAEPALLRRWVGRYELVKRVAHGGMATVYLGRAKGEAGFEKIVAVKVIHPHLASEAEFVDMFLDEARIAARLHHPHVVEILDLGESDGAYFMVMEFIEGQNLAALVRAITGPGPLLGLNIVLRIIADTLAGLAAAHELCDAEGQPYDLVHRDVSPHNILINLDGWAKVGDFGIMKAAGKPSNTKTGELRGKLAYMSPEQARGQGQIDLRTDLFAVGVILWELLTGARLFASATEASTLEKVMACEIPEFVSKRPELDDQPQLRDGLQSLLDRTLASDREQRPSSARAMLTEVKSVLRLAEELAGDDARTELAALMRRLFSARIEYDRAALRRTGEHGVVPEDVQGWAGDPTARVARPPTGSNPSMPTSSATPVPVATSGSAELQRPLTESNPTVVVARPVQWGLWLLLPMVGAGIAIAAMFALGPRFGAERSATSTDPPERGSDGSESTKPEPEPRHLAPSELAATELHPDTVSGVIQWSFTTAPSDAELFIAGEPRGRTPIAIDVPLGEELVEVRLELDGHVPQSFKLSPTSDQTISRDLLPLATTKAVTKRPHKVNKIAAPASATGDRGDEKRFIPVPESLRED